METIRTLLKKVHQGEVGMDEAVEYASKNIALVTPKYDEDGLYLEEGESPDNAPVLLTMGILEKEHTYEEQSEFLSKYHELLRE